MGLGLGPGVFAQPGCSWKITFSCSQREAPVCHLTGCDLTNLSCFYTPHGYRVPPAGYSTDISGSSSYRACLGLQRAPFIAPGICCLSSPSSNLKLKTFSPGISSLCMLRQLLAVITPAWYLFQTNITRLPSPN